MRFSATFLGLLSLSSTLSNALSAPVSEPTTSLSLSKRYTGQITGKVGDGIDSTNFPSDDEIRAAYDSVNPQGPTVFFSSIGDTRIAESFASTVGGFIFKGAYPDGGDYCKLKYNGQKRSKAWYQNFADRFSGVLAEKAKGEAFVVAPFNSEVDDCKVWKRVEFPTLQDNSAVTKVTLVNFENFDEKKTIFERGAKMMVRDGMRTVVRRDSCPEDWVKEQEAEGDSDSDSESDSEDD